MNRGRPQDTNELKLTRLEAIIANKTSGNQKKQYKHFATQSSPISERALLLEGSQASLVCPSGRGNM